MELKMFDWYWKLKSRKLQELVGEPVSDLKISLVNFLDLSDTWYGSNLRKKHKKANCFAKKYLEGDFHFTDKGYLLNGFVFYKDIKEADLFVEANINELKLIKRGLFFKQTLNGYSEAFGPYKLVSLSLKSYSEISLGTQKGYLYSPELDSEDYRNLIKLADELHLKS